MKRGLVVVLVCFSLILVLSLSIVSASGFGDFWKKITGKVTAGVDYYEYKCNENSNEICYWYSGSLGQSCNDVCVSHGGVKSPYTWNDDSGCTVMKTIFGNCPYCFGDYADGRLPMKEGIWCFYRNTSTGVNAMPGVNSKTNAQPVCACKEKKITCGDGICNGDESCLTCVTDCGDCGGTKKSNCEENVCTIYEKIGGADSDDLIVVKSSNGTSYTLRFKINEDRTNARNETTIDIKKPEGWTTVCEEKYVGENNICSIGDIDLDIKKISYTSGGDEYVVFEVVGGKVMGIGKKYLRCDGNVCKLLEGETMIIAGRVVSINWMDNDQVVLMVNGARAPASGKLVEGDSFKLADGSILKIIEINKLEVSGEVGEVIFEITGKEEEQICQSLIDRIKNPSDFVSEEGIEYKLSDNNTYSQSWWVNNEENVTVYSASWNAFYEDEYYYISYDVNVFDNKNVELSDWLKQSMSYGFCVVRDYWTENGEQNKVYVCNLNSLYESSNNPKGKDIETLWVKDNVLIDVYTSVGKGVSDKEAIKLSQKKLKDFLNDLKNNEFKSFDWEKYYVDYPLSAQIEKSLEECGSDLSLDTCSPCWSCRTEPIICPSHGQQTQTCVDSCCGEPKQTSTSECTPGICEGCLIPKWVGYDFSNNKCIPYGFRFAYETGGYTQELQEVTDTGKVYENPNDDVSFKVLNDTNAVLTFRYVNGSVYSEYELTEGEEITITLPNWADEINEIVLYVNDIYYSDEHSASNYVDIIVKGTQMVDVPITTNAYCDIDGIVKEQRTKDSLGRWANCQNNYECESNVCSSGECIEVTTLMQEASAFKKALINLWCFIVHPMSEDNRNTCKADLLGA